MLLKLYNNRLTQSTIPQDNGNILHLEHDQQITLNAAFAARYETIGLNFPTYKDGRAYSQARFLREQLCYKGDIRAKGDVLRDQILNMVRCGFTSFEVTSSVDIEGFNKALAEFSHFYQPTINSPETIAHLRYAASATSRKSA